MANKMEREHPQSKYGNKIQHGHNGIMATCMMSIKHVRNVDIFDLNRCTTKISAPNILWRYGVILLWTDYARLVSSTNVTIRSMTPTSPLGLHLPFPPVTIYPLDSPDDGFQPPSRVQQLKVVTRDVCGC